MQIDELTSTEDLDAAARGAAAAVAQAAAQASESVKDREQEIMQVCCYGFAATQRHCSTVDCMHHACPSTVCAVSHDAGTAEPCTAMAEVLVQLGLSPRL